ncbi:hypothetical protein BGZ97_009574 [Linnemannia gamsii]|uniref:Uncharacterized protein n=1 Tax=Linnemannia gamsii TaxID=64522 RepID=A0A9P6QP63_9FUNG|nr:hypothetical protein BGZ97_009574 [Linnemannia gamsii]
MKGLQGLKDIKFLSLISMFSDARLGFSWTTTVVNIHNPSQLTLNIGDMFMMAGLDDYTQDRRIGYSLVQDMRLVPGDNIMPSVLGLSATLPLAGKFTDIITTQDTFMSLWANSSATHNPALNAGLATLQTGVLLPINLIVPSPPPYSDTWTVKILPTTVDDGIFEMSNVFSNPFFNDFTLLGVATPDENPYAIIPTSHLEIQTPTLLSFPGMGFTDDLQYTVKAGQSVSVVFKMKLRTDISSKEDIVRLMTGLIDMAASGTPPPSIKVNWTPRIKLSGCRENVYPDLASDIYFTDRLFLKTGPDFPMIKDFYYKLYNISTTPVTSLPPPELTVMPPTPTTTPSVSPSPTSSPEVTPPPVAPAA